MNDDTIAADARPDPALPAPEWIEAGPRSASIAVRARPPASPDAPGLAWLGGWRSDMLGSKAETLDALAAGRGWSFLRHDYSGHGESGGDIEAGTISQWTDESLAVLDAFGGGRPHVLCGSSMGAWIAIRMALALKAAGRGDEVLALLLIAPAPDFVTRLMEPRLTDGQRASLERDGRFEEPSDYSDRPNVWTRAFMRDGADAAVLTGPLSLGCPVHIVQGTDDAEVPLGHARLLFDHLPSDDATMTVVRGGDHRLSRDEDLALIARIAADLVERAGERRSPRNE